MLSTKLADKFIFLTHRHPKHKIGSKGSWSKSQRALGQEDLEQDKSLTQSTSFCIYSLKTVLLVPSLNQSEKNV